MGIEVLLGIWALVASVTALLFWNKAKSAGPAEALSSGANRTAALPAKATAASVSDEALNRTAGSAAKSWKSSQRSVNLRRNSTS